MTELTSLLSFKINENKCSQRLCSLKQCQLTVFKESSYQVIDFVVNITASTKIERSLDDEQSFIIHQPQNDSSNNEEDFHPYFFRCDTKPSLNTWYSVLSTCARQRNPISIDDFSRITILGNGKYGKVELAKKK